MGYRAATTAQQGCLTCVKIFMLEGEGQVRGHVSVAESDLEPLKAGSSPSAVQELTPASLSALLFFAKCPAASSDVSFGRF